MPTRPSVSSSIPRLLGLAPRLFLGLSLGLGLAAASSAFGQSPEAPETDTVESGTLTTADGIPVAYEVRGSGEPTLVFVHCWACDRTMWREQVDVFAEDHRVVTFDLPGHGASGAEREIWTLDGLAADTVQLVNALDLDDFVFVGHSMGGPVSLLAAARLADAPDHRVRGIVCVDTLHDLEMKPPEEQSKAWISMFEKDFEGSLARMMTMTVPGDQNERLREDVTKVALAADRAAVVELMRDFPSLELADEAEAAGVPLRCINALAMQANLPEDALERNQARADYELTLLEAGHFLQLEKPAEFNRAMRQAFETLEPDSDGAP